MGLESYFIREGGALISEVIGSGGQHLGFSIELTDLSLARLQNDYDSLNYFGTDPIPRNNSNRVFALFARVDISMDSLSHSFRKWKFETRGKLYALVEGDEYDS